MLNSTREQLHRLEAKHHSIVTPSSTDLYCQSCQVLWPCDVAILLGAIWDLTWDIESHEDIVHCDG